MKWFQHDSDASHDSKMFDLILKYGAEGVGVYWLTVEKISAKMSGSNLTLELEESSEHLACILNQKPAATQIDAILKFCVDLSLFTYGPNKRIQCKTLLKKLDTVTGKNPEMRKMVDEMKRFQTKYEPSTNSLLPHTNRLTYKQTDLPASSSIEDSQVFNKFPSAEELFNIEKEKRKTS